MAVGGAIFSGVMSLRAGSRQKRAGRQAALAGEEVALGIESETRMNIEQTRREQAQTMGLAKANIAASGVRFDASKIAAVEFTEQEIETGEEEEEITAESFLEYGDGGAKMNITKYTAWLREKKKKEMVEPETETVETGDEVEGSSAFTYLKEMKRTFSKDIAWQGREGRSRAKVARMGGYVAEATARAGSMASIGQAAGSFGSAYTAYQQSKTPTR